MNIFMVILILLIIALLPTWPYSRDVGFGYYPSGILGAVLVILLVFALLGRL